MANIQP